MSEAGCVVGGVVIETSWPRCRAAHASEPRRGSGRGRLVDTGGGTVKPRLPCGVAVEGKLSSSTAGRLLASLHPTFEHHQMVHQLLHAGARRGRELPGRRVIHRCGDTAELVRAPRQRPGLPQQRRDRLRRRKLRPVHVIVDHAVGHAVDCAACRSQAAHDEPSSGNSWCRLLGARPGDVFSRRWPTVACQRDGTTGLPRLRDHQSSDLMFICPPWLVNPTRR
jgi:hypothetical protein